ncbi:hypothetical protein [Streptomyces sp. NBC_00059]|uniref:hypothetical protein n=1 Tax=Streptomyces sp. NBC_00059 TaxID=2975635 RepID=UPI00224E6530|nr:hypothetical protein [Streptomyces sp. NBC_00059]MCX5413325.1 hypothetical protein [Streptomyces sp. NBC_00059]
MSAVVRTVSESTWPGFVEFRSYFMSCADAFWDWPGHVRERDSVFEFCGSSDDMVAIMNRPEFRAMRNLLPAGTDAVTAFCQIYALKYGEELGLSGASGTYTLRCRLWPRVIENRDSTWPRQDSVFTHSVTGSWDVLEVTVCL